MDERTLKRLAITVIVAIAIIMLAKSMLTRTYSSLNKLNAAKKPAAHSAVVIQVTQLPGPPAASAVPADAVSAVADTSTQERQLPVLQPGQQ